MSRRYERGIQPLSTATSDQHISKEVTFCDACGVDYDEEDLTQDDGMDYCPTCLKKYGPNKEE